MGRPEVRRTIPRAEGITRLQSRRKRRVGRRWVVTDATWVDPYPWVRGTFPEKLIFAWLADKGIPFTFQARFPDYPETLTVEDFRPDFLLESFKVVIEVQGEYWHSLPDQADHDAYKFAIYEASGYKCYWMWETDILTNLAQLMGSVTELVGWVGKEAWNWEVQADDLAALRTTNARSRLVQVPKLAGPGRIRR